MSNLISKHDAINAILNQTTLQSVDELRRYVKRWEEENRWLGGVLDSIDAVDALSSVELERKKGKWIFLGPNGFKCSECGRYLGIEYGDVKMNFCPHCGSYNGEGYNYVWR